VADRLDRASGGVAIVVAPGGYGKSSQVSLWAGRDPRTVAWIDLEPGDDDPDRLADVVGESLRLIGAPHTDIPHSARLTADQYATTVAPALGRALRRCSVPFVLVFDDVHVLQSRSSVDLLDALVRNIPAGSTLVLTGRSVPPLALASLRVEDRVVDLTATDLALDATEVTDVLSAMGAPPSAPTVDELMRATEGWPLGVRLLGRALTSGGTSFRSGPEHDGVSLAHQYVEQEWLRGLPSDDAEFLSQVSGLGWVDGALCDHVLGASDSGARLERLHSSGLLVTPFHRRGDAYRVHQVARDALDAAFERRDRDAHRAVHQRACDWFTSTGDIDRAVAQALRVGDLARAEELVARHGLAYHTRGRTQTVRNWIEALPREHVLASADLCLVGAIVALGTGDGDAASAWVELADHALTHQPEDESGTAGPRVRSFRSLLWLDPLDVSLGLATQAQAELPPGRWRAATSITRGALSFASGDDDAAVDALTEAATEAQAVASPSLAAVALAHLALVRSAGDHRDDALNLSRTARGLMREHQLEHMPTLALVTAVSALVESTSGDGDVARAEVQSARTQLAYLRSVADWHHLQSYVALSSATLRLGDHVAARMFLGEAESLLAKHPDAVRYHAQLADLAERLHAARHVLPSGPSSLTIAELRVLHYLPTNLTHQEIGNRLYVSRNTSKSHAAAIYRKLSVTSRSEAVAVARAAGLLPDE
jgi:LuxR family maltose regulon positive regulatory protein